MAVLDIPSPLTGHTLDTALGISTRIGASGPLPHVSIDDNWNRLTTKLNTILGSLDIAETSLTNLELNAFSASDLPTATATVLGCVKVPTAGDSLQMTGDIISVNPSWLTTQITSEITTQVLDGGGVVAYASIDPTDITSPSTKLHNCSVQIVSAGVVKVTVDSGLLPLQICVPLVSSISPAAGSWKVAPTIGSVVLEPASNAANVTILQDYTHWNSAEDGDSHWSRGPANATELYVAIIGK
jgi:hypothetical protein